MKTLVSTIVGLLVAWLVFFKLDPWLIQQIIEMLNVTENIGIIKTILWIAIVFFTGAFTLVIATLAGLLTRIILGD